jgi:hypothetical protein
MRSATVIVGAIAVASCLIAAALVLSKNDSGSTVKKVVWRSDGPAGDAAPVGRESQTEGRGTPISCNDQVSVGPETSCALGLSVRRAYEAKGGSGKISVDDAASGQLVTVECQGEAAPIICEGEGATVYLAP